MRRVVFFEAYPHAYGGGQRQTHLLARELVARGWDVEVIAAGTGPFVERTSVDVPTTVLEPPSALGHYGGRTTGWRKAAAGAGLPRYWRSVASAFGNAALVHVNDHRGLVLAGVPARMRRVPMVWHVHAAQPSRILNRAGAMLARRTVVATSVVRDALPGFPRDHQPDVVHYAVEADVLAMAPAVRGPVPLVVCAARLYPVKGVDVLLEATALVRLDVPDVRVRVVGGVETGYDDYALEIRALRARLGLDDVVDLGGFVNRPADEWRDAWLYVQPSRHETFGVAVAEAMACAVPVVVSRTGGLTEVVEHERTGLLVPPGDPAALAAAMVALLTDRDRAARLAAAARAHVHREFTTDRMVERMVAVYDAVLAA